MSILAVLVFLFSASIMADIKEGTDSFVAKSADTRNFVSAPLACSPNQIISGSSIKRHVLYQASFQHKRAVETENEQTATWSGDLSAMMFDNLGRVRSDNGNKIIDSTNMDPIVDTCFDADIEEVRVKFSESESDRPNEVDVGLCSELTYSHSLADIGYLWRAGDVLSHLNEEEASQQRSSYHLATSNRYIRTNINHSETDFIAENFSSHLVGLLNTKNIEEAAKVVNFIRGADQEGMRPRKSKGQTLRLGDIIHSSPVVVGAPAENMHLLYDDSSYQDFLRQYRDRRTIVYVGANDGMLHAFNGGWFEEGFDKNKARYTHIKQGYSQWKLGQETWAFVPYNLLPHLKHLTRKSYGDSLADHVYFLDQSPYVFDAKIFGPDGITGQEDRMLSTHPHGWGTVMVVGFGQGGGASKVYLDPADFKGEPEETVSSQEIASVRPAYLIFDITDPEQAPKLLIEFTHDKLVSTLSVPTALSINKKLGVSDWYLAMGSGPELGSFDKGQHLLASEKNAHILMLNLKTMTLQESFGQSGVMDLGEAKTSVGDILAIDFNLDASTDALYFGTTTLLNPNAKKLSWGGKLFRLRVNQDTKARNPFWKAEVLFDARAPIVNRPMFSFDEMQNRWVHFATERFLTSADLHNKSHGMIYGVKEERNTSGLFRMDRFRSSLKPITNRQLIDVSNAKVNGQTGQLAGSVSVSPTLVDDTFFALNKRLQQFKKGSLYKAGWRKKMVKSERVIGSGTILGGVLSQATYLPKSKVGYKGNGRECKLEGDAFLYTLRHTTGTSWPQSSPQTNSALSLKKSVSVERVSTGPSPNPPPLIYVDEQGGERKVTMIHSSSEGTINTDNKQLEGNKSREISWREL